MMGRIVVSVEGRGPRLRNCHWTSDLSERASAYRGLPKHMQYDRARAAFVHHPFASVPRPRRYYVRDNWNLLVLTPEDSIYRLDQPGLETGMLKQAGKSP